MIFDRITRAKTTGAAWDDWGAPPAKPHWRPFPKWKPSLIEIVTIAAIVGVLICLLVPSGAHDRTHRYPPLVPNAGNGLAAVAGEYYQGDGRGWNLSLSILPDGRYSFLWSGCLGVYHRESGRAMDVSGYLALSAVEQTDARIARVFTPVKWGRRSYLIPPERFREFCDAVIDGDEPRDEWARGRFYTVGPADQSVGVPDLPAPWSTYLREHAVLGSIVEVAEDGRARIDAGSADGLRIDSVLTVQARGDLSRSRKLRVVAVDEHACRAEPSEIGFAELKTPLEAGWKVIAAREPL